MTFRTFSELRRFAAAADRSAFSVGDDLIDSQHKALFGRLGEAGKTVSRDWCPVQALEEILDEERKHFACEEGLLRRVRYPDIDIHIKMHQALDIRSRCIIGRLKTAKIGHEEAFIKIGGLLVKHLLYEDLKYKTWVQAHAEARDLPA